MHKFELQKETVIHYEYDDTPESKNQEEKPKEGDVLDLDNEPENAWEEDIDIPLDDDILAEEGDKHENTKIEESDKQEKTKIEEENKDEPQIEEKEEEDEKDNEKQEESPEMIDGNKDGEDKENLDQKSDSLGDLDDLGDDAWNENDIQIDEDLDI